MNYSAAQHRGNRLKHGIRLWLEYVDSRSPRQLDKWLSERLRAEKKFGSKDRKFYSDLLFSASRLVTATLFRDFLQREFCVAELNHFFHQDAHQREEQVFQFTNSVQSEDLLWSAIRSLSGELVITDASDALASESNEPSAKGAISEFQYWLKDHVPAQSEEDFEKAGPLLLLAYGIPPSWAPYFNRRRSQNKWDFDQVLRFLASQNTRAPLWIRLNQLDRKQEVEQDLESHDLSVSWLNGGNAAIVSGSFGVYQCDSFKAGYFEVQDVASQQIAAKVTCTPGEKIWDSCAGGGGKTVALAAALRGKGALYASDIREHKLAEAKRRCQRAGFHNLRTFVWDGESVSGLPKEIYLQAGFDGVLVDAPCSSSGTWRRNPDARLRVSTPASRAELFNLQLKLLTRASEQVRPGGRLVYGTCSWCVEENESIAELFLSANSEFSSVSEDGSFGALLGNPAHDADTMFAVSFERRVR